MVNKLSTGILMSVAALLMVSMVGVSTATAGAAGYWTTKSGEVWRTEAGQCWRTSHWEPKHAIAECEGIVDSDGDGIADDADTCPNTPTGTKVGANGCEQDLDGDGIVDSKDRCPNTMKGADIDNHGCKKQPIDSDNDGVTDSKDRCPNTEAGTTVDATGCELDSDGDGVVDSKDRCSATPKGTDVDASGCKKQLVDSDGDGVADSQDRCPNTGPGLTVDAAGCELDSDGDGVVDSKDRCTASASGEAVDASGCKLEENIVLKGVNFETNSDLLTGGSYSSLDEVAETLKRYPTMKVEVAGYTDSSGKVRYNQMLSQKRAEAVVSYLISKGVPAANLKAKGYGPASPIADNGTRAGRAINRRVELNILTR